MLTSTFAVYLGAEGEGRFAGFTAHDNFFAILETEGESTQDHSQALKALGTKVGEKHITTLSALEDVILPWLREHNLPTSISFACLVLVDSKALVKTVGEGEIFIKRGHEFAKLLSGDKSASGFAETGDYVVLTTKRFEEVAGQKHTLDTLPYEMSPHELVEEITPSIKSTDDTGTVALFLNLAEKVVDEPVVGGQEEEQAAPLAEPVYTPPTPSPPKKNAWSGFAAYMTFAWDRARELPARYGRKKTITFIVVGIIFLVFLWSVLFGNQRRQAQEDKKKIAATAELVHGQLDQAQEVSFLNLARAQALLADARGEYNGLKKELGDRKYKEMDELNAQITSREGEILKKENKAPQEFFDLAVEKKEAKGVALGLSGEDVAILDPAGVVYTLSLTQKSLDKATHGEIKGATLVAKYETNLFVFNPTLGIVKIDEDGKVQKIVPKDSGWGKIVSIQVFGGNIYLLDAGKSKIYKYTPTEKGYSDALAYIKDGGADLRDANSMAIDAAVYVGLPDTIIKYVAGARDSFATTFPQSDSAITRIFTNEDSQKVYAWDKKAGAIYILGKTGEYERQVTSDAFKNASDVIVYKDTAYLLTGQKIFTVDVR